MRLFMLLFITTILSFPVTGGVLDGANLDNHLYGDQVSEKDLKGKVVFVEYWGINCPPCRASFPHLVKLQKKYASTGKFTMFASHVQGLTPAVKKFLADQNVNFPVYHQARLSNAPSTRGIPNAHIFDHTGKVVASGHPAQLYDKLEALIAQTPSPLLHGITPKHCKSEAKKIASGKSWASAVKSLKSKIEKGGDSAEEAKALLANVEDHLSVELSNGKKMIETHPSKAYRSFVGLSKKASGLPEGDEAKTLSKDLYKDKSLKKLMKIIAGLEKVRANGGVKSKKNAKMVASIRHSLEKLSNDEAVSAGVSSEAKDLLSQI